MSRRVINCSIISRTFRDWKESREDPKSAAQRLHESTGAEQGDDARTNFTRISTVTPRAQGMAQHLRGDNKAAME